MRRLSSKWTFFYKKLFPLFWLLMVVAMLVAGVCASAFSKTPGTPPAIIFAIFPVIMIFVGYFIIKNLILDLLDEVWDEGDSLVLVKSGTRESIHIDDIINVSDTYMVNPPRITLLLRQPCRFGREVVFTPARSFTFSPFKKSEIARELMTRVHKL